MRKSFVRTQYGTGFFFDFFEFLIFVVMGKRKIVLTIDGPTGSSGNSSKRGSSLQVEQKSPILDEEKRALRKGNLTNSIRERIYRANSQRMYLINQMDMTNTSSTSSVNGDEEEEDNKVNITTIDETKLLCRKFTILGSTGNVYDVLIHRFPSCNCPDFGRSHLCKHILFVLLKVLHVPLDSNLLYQRALLQSELKEIFCGLQTNDLGRVLAKQEVIRAYNNKASGNKSSSSNEVEEDKDTIREPEGECAICFEPMIGASSAIKGNVESLDSCRTCHNFLHTDCLKQWLKQSNSCVYCRSQWSDKSSSSSVSRSGGVMEGYVNLSSIQGMSSRRDTSTYHDYTLERMYHEHDDDD
jgi:hypothetical protein